MASSSASASSSSSKKKSNHSKFELLSVAEMMAVMGSSSSNLVIYSNDEIEEKMKMQMQMEMEMEMKMKMKMKMKMQTETEMEMEMMMMMMKMMESVDCEQVKPSHQPFAAACPPPPQHVERMEYPGERIIIDEGIDDYPERENSCHQCRQKTRKYVAICKAFKFNKPCPLKFCDGCLLSRYGEVAKEVNRLSFWPCPKCRNDCNCSVCMKDKGFNPTGNLKKKKGKSGLPASEILKNEGHENVCGKLGKRNPSREDNIDGGVQKPKRTRRSKKATVDNVKGVEEEITGWNNGGTGSQSGTTEEIIQKKARKTKDKHIPDVPLPQGVDLTTVAGIDIPPEDIGHALQFLEFCDAFGEVLNMKKGQAESILQELTNQCSRVRGQYSVVVQFYIQLLSLIQKDMSEGSNNGTYSWLQALEKFISESNRALINLPSDCFAKDGVGYESLAPSKKLRLLNFLCDESLSTMGLRSCIDFQDFRINDTIKQAKDIVFAAQDKEESLKQKVGEVTKDYISNIGASSSIYEHENLVSQTKAEASQAHVETREAMTMVPKKKQRSDAIRTDPVFLDGKGWAFWRLRSCSSVILLQEIRSCDSSTAEEKWFIYDKENIKEVENYISSARKKSRRRQRQVASDEHDQGPVTSDTSIKNET